MTEIGTLLQNRYLLKEKIGKGGMGAVYLATDQKFDNPVAVKETFYKEDEFAEAFEREAKLLNGLQHPALPHVSDYFADEDGYFIVMQFIEGEDLSDILKREGAFSIADVVRWTESLLDALDYLHTQNPPVIHRDIKPHNLKLTPRGDIMLLDFGLAKLNQKDATEVSVFGYSRTYSPLEQIQGTGTDARSDIFALGATVYHLLTGKAPVNALTRASAIVNGNPDPLQMAHEIRREVPEDISAVIHTALALNAQNRFATAEAMCQALKHAARQIDAPASPKIVKQSVGAENTVRKDDSFAALESFAATQQNSFSNHPDVSPKKPARTGDLKHHSATPLIVDIEPSVSGGQTNSQSRMIVVAAAILLFFGIAAALYFNSGGGQAEATTQTANASAPAVETASEKKEKTSTTEKPDEKPAVEKPKNETVKQARVSSKSEDKQAPEKSTTPEVEQEQPEEIVVDEPEVKEPKVKRRQQTDEIPDEMTEEEFQRIKREEKQKRRARREPSKTPEIEQEN